MGILESIFIMVCYVAVVRFLGFSMYTKPSHQAQDGTQLPRSYCWLGCCWLQHPLV